MRVEASGFKILGLRGPFTVLEGSSSNSSVLSHFVLKRAAPSWPCTFRL